MSKYHFPSPFFYSSSSIVIQLAGSSIRSNTIGLASSSFGPSIIDAMVAKAFAIDYDSLAHTNIGSC